MERTERYDPEDLEQMMLDRGFDALLDEERAFALRHLESRAEYERMRTLLLEMQHLDQHRPPMDADPKVRENVLAAFRAQQQPQWRIWLNSVAAFLMPRKPALYWRPALALGAVAALTFTLINYQANQGMEKLQLAEVKQAEAVAPAAATVAEPSKPASITVDTPQAAGTESFTNHESENAVPPPPPSANKPVSPETAAKTSAAAKSIAAAVVPAQDSMMDAAGAARAGQGLATVSRAQSATAKAEQSVPATGVAADLAEERTKESTSTRKRSAYADAGQAAASAAAYTEDDLLGLLRAAW